MAKALSMLLMMAVLSGMAWGMDVSIEGKAKWFSPGEEAFREIYGGGIGWGGAVVFGLSEHWEVSLEADWFSRNGELTYTREPTEMSLFALGVEGRYLFPLKGVTLFAGPGAYLYHFHEDNRMGKAKKSGPGFMLKAGALVPLSQCLRLNLFAGYSFCRITPVNIEFSVGGFAAGLGLRYTFE